MCVKFWSECPDIFFPYAEINDEKDVDLPFISFITMKKYALVLCTKIY